MRRTEGCPLFDFFGAVQHGAEIMCAVNLRGTRHQPGEDVDRGAGQKRAKFLALGQRCHEKGLAPGACERRRDLCHAKAIGIGLDHGAAFCGGRKIAQAAVIGGEGAEIDGEDCRLA